MNLTNKELEEIKDFVWDRLDRTCISYFEWTGPDLDDNEHAYYSLREAMFDMKAKDVFYGCTKSCFEFTELENFVIKIPFTGECWDEYEEDDEYEEYPETKYAEYEYGGGRGWDYCDIEAELYQYAVEAGVDDLLCGTWFLGLFEGYPIYVSEKAAKEYNYRTRKEYTYRRPSYSSAMANSIAKRNRDYFGSDILSIMIDAQGVRQVNKLMSFIQEHDISDFHNGNFMFAKDGSLRLIDYSSFHYW